MINRRSFVATASAVPLALLAGCAGLGGDGGETTTKTTKTTSTRPTTPSNVVKEKVSKAATHLEDAQTTLGEVQVVRGDQVYFDPAEISPFKSSSVTDHVAKARELLEEARDKASGDVAAIKTLESVATIFEERAAIIPLIDEAMGTYTVYNSQVNNGQWTDAMSTMEDAIKYAQSAFKHQDTAFKAAAGLDSVTQVNGFDPERQRKELEILGDAFRAMGAAFSGFYHTGLGMSWWEFGLHTGSQEKYSAAAEAMGKSLEAFKYALSGLMNSLQNEQSVFQQEAIAHRCAADAIGAAAQKYQQAYQALEAGNSQKAKDLGSQAIRILEQEECDVAYEEHALERAKSKGPS